MVQPREAIGILQSLNVRHLPVVDKHGELVGMLSDRDFKKYSLSHLSSEVELDSLGIRLETPVSRIMSTAVFAVDPETDVRDVANLMIDQQIGAVPVVSSEGALMGFVSYVDLIREHVSFAATA
jgi:acetoin utilization protein AcuB